MTQNDLALAARMLGRLLRRAMHWRVLTLRLLDHVNGGGAHARRQFLEAVQLNPRDPVATPIVERMDELFAVDAEARRRELVSLGVMLYARKEPSLSWRRSVRTSKQHNPLHCPPRALSKACQYALTLWRKLS